MIPDQPFAIERLIGPAGSAGEADAMTRHVIGAAPHARRPSTTAADAMTAMSSARLRTSAPTVNDCG